MKDWKMYEAPASEVVELEVSVALLAGSTNVEGVLDQQRSVKIGFV